MDGGSKEECHLAFDASRGFRFVALTLLYSLLLWAVLTESSLLVLSSVLGRPGQI